MAKLIRQSRGYKILNGIELIKRREALGITQAEFADYCGWSAPYQSRIESSGRHEVHKHIADTIIQTLDILSIS